MELLSNNQDCLQAHVSSVADPVAGSVLIVLQVVPVPAW
jgi:hypothetical protein